MSSSVLEKISEVKVITQPGCQPCKATLRRLGVQIAGGSVVLSSVEEASAKLGYKITILDTASEHGEEARTLASQLGYMSAPVVAVYDGDGNIIEHWSGFAPSKLDGIDN
jgi:glutaredoxin